MWMILLFIGIIAMIMGIGGIVWNLIEDENTKTHFWATYGDV